jgi:TM2 domain-containing membrane protein YozV
MTALGPSRPPTERPNLPEWAEDSRERRHTVGVLGIAMGFLGVHRFLLGRHLVGVLILLSSIVSCGTIGWIIGVLDGARFLAMSDEEFHTQYVAKRKTIV